MADDAKRFRQRAFDCRQLAKSARDPRDRQLLDDLAMDLEEEAKKIDAESEARPNGD